MFNNLFDLQRKRQMQGVLGDDPMQADYAPQEGGTLQPANITPASVSPLGMGQASDSPDPNQMVWGHTLSEMFPSLFQGAGRLQPPRQQMAPRLTAAPMGSPMGAQQRY